jgi:LysM repeat protein
MRLTRKLIVAAAVALALTGCSKQDEKSFPKVDYNKDGKIIFEELIVAFPDLTVEEFLAADADGNGTLDEKEYERFRQARQSGKKLEPQPKTTPAPVTPAAPAQPAAPATPPPAPATSEAAPTTTPQAAPAPAAQASPAAPATPPAAKEVVETVEAPAPDKPAEAAGATSYTVQRGDTLTRIAKKFEVTPKAIMAANEMKNADHMEAGAILTIPGKGAPAGQAAPAAVTDFVKSYFAKSDAGDVNALLDSYADTVDYYKSAKAGRDAVRQDKAEFFSRWPERAYTPGRITVVGTTKQGNLTVSVPVVFKASSGTKASSGKAVFTFTLRPEGESYRIVGEKSVVDKRK